MDRKYSGTLENKKNDCDSLRINKNDIKEKVDIIDKEIKVENKEILNEQNNSEENENSDDENIDDLLKEVDEEINKSI